jgi:pilus assembly protein CpaB
MSSTALKVLALVTLVLALGLGYTAYRMSQARPSAAPVAGGGPGQGPQIMAIVALKPIEAFAPIPRDAVALVPVAVPPDEYFKNVDDVAGRAPLADIPTGTTITPRYFRESKNLVRSIPPGFQAMSMEINDVIAVGGFVRPGDLVDVLVYIRSSGQEVQDSQARILLQNARVLAYEDRVLADADSLDNGGNGDNKQKTTTRRIRTAVIAVPEAETTRVMLGASLGELRLSLRVPEPAVTELQTDASGQAARPAPETSKPEDEKVITLKELAALKKKQSSGTAAEGPPPVIVYRGSKVGG